MKRAFVVECNSFEKRRNKNLKSLTMLNYFLCFSLWQRMEKESCDGWDRELRGKRAMERDKYRHAMFLRCLPFFLPSVDSFGGEKFLVCCETSRKRFVFTLSVESLKQKVGTFYQFSLRNIKNLQKFIKEKYWNWSKVIEGIRKWKKFCDRKRRNLDICNKSRLITITR